MEENKEKQISCSHDLSKAHAMEMFGKQEPAHMEAMMKMQHLMQDPNAMKEFMEEKQKQFEALPNN